MHIKNKEVKMIFDFEKMELTTIPKFKGGEKEISANMFRDNYGMFMRAVLKPGASIGYHKHENNGEIVYALSGKAKVLYNDGEEVLMPGRAHYCPKGNSHSIINEGSEDFVMFCVVPNQA